MTKLSKSFIVVGSAVVLLLAAVPAFAMRLESEALPPSTSSTHATQAASSAAPVSVPPVAAPAATAPQAVTQAAPDTRSSAAPDTPVMIVDASPRARASAAQAQAAAAHVDSPAPAPATKTAEPVAAAPVEQSKVIALPPTAPSSDGEVEFSGNIDSITGTLPNLTLMINGNTVKTDSQTEIAGVLTVGKLVQVKGNAQPDGSILATSIQVEDVPGDEGEVEFRGPIVSLPGTSDFTGLWVVGDFTMTVNISTTIDQSGGAVVVGAIAEVKAVRQLDGSLLAVSIKIEAANEFENEAEFKGLVSNLTGSAPMFTMLVNAITVTTNSQTQISGTLANGVLVEVHGSTQPDGSVLATVIKVEQPEVEPIEEDFTAHISGTLPVGLLGTWTFDNGKSVTVDAHTLIDQSHGLVAPGVLVEVKAVKQPDNSWLAVQIKVEND